MTSGIRSRVQRTEFAAMNLVENGSLLDQSTLGSLCNA
jgi:hypothetical protein